MDSFKWTILIGFLVNLINVCGIDGRPATNLGGCESTYCAGLRDMCKNGGRCVEDPKNRCMGKCQCSRRYSGPFCEVDKSSLPVTLAPERLRQPRRYGNIMSFFASLSRKKPVKKTETSDDKKIHSQNKNLRKANQKPPTQGKKSGSVDMKKIYGKFIKGTKSSSSTTKSPTVISSPTITASSTTHADGEDGDDSYITEKPKTAVNNTAKPSTDSETDADDVTSANDSKANTESSISSSSKEDDMDGNQNSQNTNQTTELRNNEKEKSKSIRETMNNEAKTTGNATDTKDNSEEDDNQTVESSKNNVILGQDVDTKNASVSDKQQNTNGNFDIVSPNLELTLASFRELLQADSLFSDGFGLPELQDNTDQADNVVKESNNPLGDIGPATHGVSAQDKVPSDVISQRMSSISSVHGTAQDHVFSDLSQLIDVPNLKPITTFKPIESTVSPLQMLFSNVMVKGEVTSTDLDSNHHNVSPKQENVTGSDGLTSVTGTVKHNDIKSKSISDMKKVELIKNNTIQERNRTSEPKSTVRDEIASNSENVSLNSSDKLNINVNSIQSSPTDSNMSMTDEIKVLRNDLQIITKENTHVNSSIMNEKTTEGLIQNIKEAIKSNDTVSKLKIMTSNSKFASNISLKTNEREKNNNTNEIKRHNANKVTKSPINLTNVSVIKTTLDSTNGKIHLFKDQSEVQESDINNKNNTTPSSVDKEPRNETTSKLITSDGNDKKLKNFTEFNSNKTTSEIMNKGTIIISGDQSINDTNNTGNATTARNNEENINSGDSRNIDAGLTQSTKTVKSTHSNENDTDIRSVKGNANVTHKENDTVNETGSLSLDNYASEKSGPIINERDESINRKNINIGRNNNISKSEGMLSIGKLNNNKNGSKNSHIETELSYKKQKNNNDNNTVPMKTKISKHDVANNMPDMDNPKNIVETTEHTVNVKLERGHNKASKVSDSLKIIDSHNVKSTDVKFNALKAVSRELATKYSDNNIDNKKTVNDKLNEKVSFIEGATVATPKERIEMESQGDLYFDNSNIYGRKSKVRQTHSNQESLAKSSPALPNETRTSKTVTEVVNGQLILNTSVQHRQMITNVSEVVPTKVNISTKKAVLNDNNKISSSSLKKSADHIHNIIIASDNNQIIPSALKSEVTEPFTLTTETEHGNGLDLPTVTEANVVLQNEDNTTVDISSAATSNENVNVITTSIQSSADPVKATEIPIQNTGNDSTRTVISNDTESEVSSMSRHNIVGGKVFGITKLSVNSESEPNKREPNRVQTEDTKSNSTRTNNVMLKENIQPPSIKSKHELEDKNHNSILESRSSFSQGQKDDANRSTPNTYTSTTPETTTAILYTTIHSKRDENNMKLISHEKPKT